MSVALLDGGRDDGTMGVPRRMGRQLFRALAEFRTLMMSRINDVNSTTMREVMAAASSVGAVVEGASEHIAQVKQMVSSLDGEGGGGGVAGAIARQGDVLRRFFESVSRDIAHQEATAQRAQTQLQRITKAASDTANLAGAARLLALNARIEAARVGGNGNCFSTIAGEMQHLAEEITRANEFIDGLAGRLSQDLPELATTAHALRTSSEALRDDLSSAARDVDAETAAMRDVIRRLLESSDHEMAKLIGTSHEALSHLQFQDVIAQGLLRLEPPLRDLQLEHANELGVPELAAELPPAQHVEIGGDKPVDQQNAGEVLLF